MENTFALTEAMQEQMARDLSVPGKLKTVDYAPKSTTECDQGSLRLFRSDSTERTTVTFIEDEGYMILRVSSGGDLVMNQDQVKLLIRQLVFWITK